MTTRLIPCAHCIHFDPSDREKSVCAAFPKGIPIEIIAGRVTHRTPYPGDHGIRWRPTPGYEKMFSGMSPENEPYGDEP